MQHHTNTLQPTETGIVTIDVILGPGINEVQICNPSADTPIADTVAEIPSLHAIASAKSTLPLATPHATVVAPVTLVI